MLFQRWQNADSANYCRPFVGLVLNERIIAEWLIQPTSLSALPWSQQFSGDTVGQVLPLSDVCQFLNDFSS